MRKIKDVLRIKLDAKLSHQQIADALGLSKGVVTKYAGLGGRRGLGLARIAKHGRGGAGAAPVGRLEIINDRAGNKATIITSQLPVEHWHAWIGDATIADAILDRVLQRNHRFTLTGDSLRDPKQKTAKKEKKTDPS